MKKELNFIGLKNYLLDDVKIKKEVIQYYLKRIKNVIDYYKKNSVTKYLILKRISF